MGLPAHFVEPQAAWIYGGFRILRFLSWELGLRVPDVTVLGLEFRVEGSGCYAFWVGV